VTPEPLSREELADSLRQVADMLENLIPLFDCGCAACLERAGKLSVQLGEELIELAKLGAHLIPAGDHPDYPVELAEPEITARAIRRSARLLRMQAARVERQAGAHLT
jgi:hypothetical protein